VSSARGSLRTPEQNTLLNAPNVDIAVRQIKKRRSRSLPPCPWSVNVQKNFGPTQSLALLEQFQASIART
jgi:hypothetical protein